MSDSYEPAEGEHKIMRFIRYLRTRPDYRPDTRHVIYGQVCVCGGVGGLPAGARWMARWPLLLRRPLRWLALERPRQRRWRG